MLLLGACLAGLLGACAQVPPEAATLNALVGTGIERMRADTVTILEAWRQSRIEAVGNATDDLYDEAQAAVRRKAAKSRTDPLNAEEERDLAVLFSHNRQSVIDDINGQFDALIAKANASSSTVLSMNQTVTEVIESAVRVEDGRRELLESLKYLNPIPVPGIR